MGRDDGIKIFNMEDISLYDIYRGLVKSRTTKKTLKSAIESYQQELRNHVEYLPALELCNNLYCASRFLAYIKKCVRFKNEFTHKGFVIPDGFIKQNVVEIEQSFENTIGPLLSPLTQYAHVTEPPIKAIYPGSSVKFVMIPQAYLMAFTSLEVYLEDRLRIEVFSSPEKLIRFCQNIPSNRFPRRWKKEDRQIEYWEYSTNIREIVSEYLQFPYHSFEGEVDRAYSHAFRFHLAQFSGISKLVSARQTRNKIVHRGLTSQSIYVSLIEYKDVEKLINLCLSFAEYIEQNIKHDKSAPITSH